MAEIAINFRLDGTIKGIYDDDYDFERIHGKSSLKRAGIVDPIETGMNAGKWLVDMHLLGNDFTYCLWPPFATRKEALAAEHEIVERYIRGQNKQPDQKKQ